MSRFLVSLFAFLILALSAMAQKVRFEKTRVPYTVIPSFKNTFSTYNVELLMPGFDFARYGIKAADTIQLKTIIGSGLKLKPVTKDADLQIRLTLGSQKSGSAIVNEEYIRRTPPGQRETSFIVRFNLDMPGRLEVFDKNGNKLLDEPIDNYIRQESDFINVRLEEEAKASFIKMWQPTLYARTKSVMISHAQAISRKLNRKLYGESSVSEGYFMSFTRAAKFNLQTYDEWLDKTIAALKTSAAEGNTDKIKTSLQEPMQFWLKEYESVAANNDELSREKKFVCTYNLAHAYSWTGDTENTKKFLEACIAINLSGAGAFVTHLDQNIKARN